MAATREGRLTNNHIVHLARAISSRDVESIALGYLGIEERTIKNFKDARREEKERFSGDLVQKRANKNCRPNQCRVSFKFHHIKNVNKNSMRRH